MVMAPASSLSAVRSVLLVLAVGAFAGCAGMQKDLQSSFTPGQIKEDSHIHAYSAAAFAHAFLSGHMVEWDARLTAVEDDLPPFFDAIDKAGYRFDVKIEPHQTKGDLSYEYHDVNLVLLPKSGKGERFELPGAPGTRVTDYVKALAPAATKLAIPAEVLRRGHFALYLLDGMTASLSASDDSLRRQVFGLLVLRDKLQRKEPNADHLAPMRPPEKSIEDVNLALRVLAEHFAATARVRAEVLAIMAMARQYEVPTARTMLAEQAADSRRRAKAWEAEHHNPTMEEFGVAMKEFKLPTPDAMLEVLDKDGYISAAIKIAKGLATGDAASTVEGFGKLAPANSSLRIASEGAASALRGDVAGVSKAVLSLAEKQPDIEKVTSRLRSVEQAVADARSATKR